MDKTAQKQVRPVERRAKKPVKDELDRIKQAEKKKRRLEKALATSAAIRSELEKKKQKKKEEQQRCDEEAAAIAEAVALHVLLEEDADDSCQIMLNEEKCFEFNPWEYTGNIPHQNYAIQEIGFTSTAYRLGNGNCSLPYETFRRYGWNSSGLPADLIAAEAVASLQISEDAEADAIVFNGIFRG